MSTMETLLGLFLLANQHSGAIGPTGAEPSLDLTPHSVIIRATSTGCTQKRHFRLIQDANQGLKVQRLKQDRCQQPAQEVEFHYSYQQLGLKPPMRLPMELKGPLLAINH